MNQYPELGHDNVGSGLKDHDGVSLQQQLQLGDIVHKKEIDPFVLAEDEERPRELDLDPEMEVSEPEPWYEVDAGERPKGSPVSENRGRRSEREIRILEIRYRRLFEAARDGILILNPLTRKITDANPFMSELLGYRRDELLGKELCEIGLIKDEAASRSAFLELQTKRFVRYDNLPLQSKTGESHHVEFVSNLYEEDGHDVIQCNIRDVTQRKCAEEQIAQQAAFLDEATNAILVRDLEGKIIFWNKGAERMYGWTREEAMGRNIAQLLYAYPPKFEEVNRLTLKMEEWSGEFMHLTKDKRELVIEARCTLIRDQEGNPKSVLAIYTDITEKKQREVQSMRAQRMESLGMLSGGIAHDLNNVLTPILMSIEVLRDTSDDPKTKAILQTIEICAKRGSDIVRQVLSFARGLEGQKIAIEPRTLLDDIESIIKGTFPKDIRLTFSVADNIRSICGDPTQLHLVLLNLCVNARDAMPHGGDLSISFTNAELDEKFVATHSDAQVGNYIKLTVTDSGLGIPAHVLNKVFDPFFTTKPFTKGTGLGLSTVMAIVKGHEGIIILESEVAKGTTFDIYLPAVDRCGPPGVDIAQESGLPRGNGETVLVVDDEVCILAVTGHTLEAFGYRVITAKDGAEAVAVYLRQKKEVSVVLTDMMMPVMDGPAVIQALLEINPDVKIIAASGLTSEEGVAKAGPTGVRYCLTKPYTASTLLTLVRKVLHEDNATDPALKINSQPD